MTESKLFTNKHILLCDSIPALANGNDLNFIKTNFCGTVASSIDNLVPEDTTNLYICGDLSQIHDKLKDLKFNKYIIKDFSSNYDGNEGYTQITAGQVPININNCGVYFRNFFDNKDYFDLLKGEHEFQSLTESNKPGNAFRKGIYLSKVEQNDTKTETTFNLLRCSSNLDGPTDNFRQTDNEIITAVNNVAADFFDNPAPLNHVLAQVYENTGNKKAKISAHSDKTKDMPFNGIMAFCTFYDSVYKLKTQSSPLDVYDKQISNISVYTKLVFRMKHGVNVENMAKEFTVNLYPNSVFMMSLTTNRLYTHEIRPSALPAEMIPTRMGYVIRCSKTKAVFKENQTYIVDENNADHLVTMRPINEKDIIELRKLYLDENLTDDVINYGLVDYSMNNGDYLCPNV